MSSLFTPLISSTFPSPRGGKFTSQGYAPLRLPALRPTTLATPKRKETGKPLFDLQEVGFALYYPTETGSWWAGQGRVGWLPPPAEAMAEGYAKFLGNRAVGFIKRLAFLIKRMKFRAKSFAPLLPPSSLNSDKPQYPLIIFSHGLAGTRNTYSQYCQDLASRGYVVLAVEHRDGSAPAVTVRPGSSRSASPSSSDTAIGEEKEGDEVLFYVKHEELDFTGDSESSLMHFRTLQLNFRVSEVYESYHALRQLLSSSTTSLPGTDLSKDQQIAWLDSFRDSIDFDQVYLTGHSFGGGTIFNLLQSPSDSYEPIPVKKAIALDPWLEPMPTPAASTKPPKGNVPMMVINSPGFTEWKDHFERLVGMVKKMDGWLMTVTGGNHQSFSDFPVLVPFSGAGHLLDRFHELSFAFIQGDLARTPSVEGRVADEGKVELNAKGKMEGKSGEVRIHLVGSS